MTDDTIGSRIIQGIDRRRLLKSAVAAGALIAGGMPGGAFAQDATAAQEISPEGGLTEIAREDSLVLGWSFVSPIGVVNPWSVPGYTHQDGGNLLWEPLMFFGIFADEEIPWLAESMEYTSDDFTSLRIKLNPAARWSDGVPVTSKDVLFTFQNQYDNNRLPYHAAFQQFMESATAVDDHTVDLQFKIPAPRFKFEVLTEKFDTGIPIVPAHAFDGVEDITEYAGGTEMPHSGPYDLIAWNANQKILDLREDWWGAEAGIAPLPQVKRVVLVNLGGRVGQNMDVVAQRIVNNEMDSALDMRSSVIANILAQNDKTTTHTGDESPYGYLDWWPNSLWVNTQLAPYDDPLVRRAVSRAINRELIDEILYEGAKIATIYPFPLYPGLQAFVDSPEVKALEEKYQPGLYDPDESAALMRGSRLRAERRRHVGEGRRDRQHDHPRLRGHPQRHRPDPRRDAAQRRFRRGDQLRHRRLPEHGRRRAGPLHVRPRSQPQGSLRGARAVPWTVRRIDRKRRRAATASRVTRTRNTTRFSTRWRRSPPRIRSSTRTPPRRSRSTGATRSTSRSSSGCTGSPTTRPTGPTGRPPPIPPWAPTARSGHIRACR